MLLIKLVPVAEWRLWPLVSNCTCENATGKKLSLPFLELYIVREKVVA